MGRGTIWLICSHTLLYRATSELQLVPWMHWYLEFATLKQFHLKASSKQWVAMRCYAAAESCSLICLPPSQMHLQARRSARPVARPILQPGSSYHLKTMMQRYLRKKNSHDASVRGNSWTSALRKLIAHECRASKIDHIKYQPNSAPCCRVLVPRNDSVVPAGILESMAGGDLPKLHSETLQQDGPQGNLVGEPFWYHCKPLEFVRSEANLTTSPLEPLRAWICRSYWQDTVGTWRCPVAVAVAWNDLATL